MPGTWRGLSRTNPPLLSPQLDITEQHPATFTLPIEGAKLVVSQPWTGSRDGWSAVVVHVATRHRAAYWLAFCDLPVADHASLANTGVEVVSVGVNRTVNELGGIWIGREAAVTGCPAVRRPAGWYGTISFRSRHDGNLPPYRRDTTCRPGIGLLLRRPTSAHPSTVLLGTLVGGLLVTHG